MLVVALHRRYQRTCDECGYRWELTRKQAQLRVKRPHVGRTGGPQMALMQGQMDRYSELMAQQEAAVEAYSRCERCGSHSYTQRPLRGHAGDSDEPKGP